MANTIKIKNSGTTTAVPSTLEHGELGLNYADGKLFYKNSSNVIVEFSSGGTSSLDGLSDAVITSPEEFQSLVYDGANWVNKHAPVVSYVRNAESTTLTTGTAVYLFGATGDHASVKRADNDSDTTSSKVIGLVGANIAASQNGPVITRGYVDGIDLSVGYTAGDILWLGEDGAFTKTKPSAPEHLVFIGVVVRATNNGIVYVATQNGYELEELHDVDINPNTLASGDFLKWNGSLWVNDPINLGTDTVGNYMSNVTAGNLITVTHTPGEGSSAAIAVSNGTSGQIIVANATGVPTWVTESGDLTIDASGVTSITSNVIVNADINTGAAISHSKLANATPGQILLGTTTTGVITATTVSGDIAITGAGVVTIQPNSVALGTDTTGDYVSSLVAGTGITLTNNSGESATPTVALTNTSLTINGTSISLGGSGTITANAATLTGTTLNSSVVSSSLTSVGTLTALSVSGNVSVTGSVVDHVIISSPVLTVGTYTLVLTDDGKMIEINSGAAANVSVPADNSVNFPVGTSIDILQVGTGQVTIAPAAGVTINRATGLKLRAQWSAATLIKRAANTWVAVGDLSA